MIVKSLNAGRHPQFRTQVLERELHRFPCPACNRILFVDTDFFWFDWHRKQFIGVFPTRLRSQPESCDEVLVSTFERNMKEHAPLFVKDYARGFFVRTVFGVEELREKVLVHEAGLDDFLVEMLKVEVLTSHPEMLERGIVTLRLDQFHDDGSLLFFPEGQDGSLLGDPPIALGVNRGLYDALVPHREELLRDRAEVVSGSHVSLRRIADAIDAQEAVVP